MAAMTQWMTGWRDKMSKMASQITRSSRAAGYALDSRWDVPHGFGRFLS